MSASGREHFPQYGGSVPSPLILRGKSYAEQQGLDLQFFLDPLTLKQLQQFPKCRLDPGRILFQRGDSHRTTESCVAQLIRRIQPLGDRPLPI
ncbi:MAG: hypothetical protein ACPGN3_03000 [Opitutales bacterium]